MDKSKSYLLILKITMSVLSSLFILSILLRNLLEKPNVFDQYAMPINLIFIALMILLIIVRRRIDEDYRQKLQENGPKLVFWTVGAGLILGVGMLLYFLIRMPG